MKMLGRVLESPWDSMGTTCVLPLLERDVPFVVGAICILIVVLFLIAWTWLESSTGRFTWSFSRLTKRMRGIRSRDEAMDEAKLEQVEKLLLDHRSTEHGWKEFKETLVHEERGVLNTRPAQDFFPEHEIVEARIHLAFFDAVPALLTGLGLFATFFALYLGLGDLRVPQGGNIEGVQEFINALSGKFLSSVIGLATAVFFTFRKSFRVPKAHRIYRRFCDAFDALFDRITPEELLRKLSDQAAEQSATLKHLATDISDGFNDRMNENLTPPLMRMIELLQQSVEERSSTFEQMAQNLAETFRSSFSQSTNFEFEHVSQALERTVSLVESMESRSAASQSSFDSLIQSLTASTNELSARLTAAASDLGSTQAEARSALEDTVRRVLEANSRQAEQSGERMERAIASLDERMSSVLLSLEGAASGLREGGVAANAQLMAAAEGLTRELAAGATSTTRTLAGTAEKVMERNASQSAEFQTRLEALLDREEGRADAVSRQLEAQRESVRELERVLGQSSAMLQGLREVSAGFNETGSTLRNAADQVRSVQDAAAALIEASGRNASHMESILNHNRDLLNRYEAVLRQADQSIGNAVSTVAAEILKFEERSTEILRHQLSRYDESLGSATSKLGTQVQELGERLDDAADAISAGLERFSRP
ncbi:MAG: hypothetical protein ACQGVK_18995 [Myxococcota bacterium]